MSEFTCKNGHLMKARDRVCPECGNPAKYMDGHINDYWDMDDGAPYCDDTPDDYGEQDDYWEGI